MCSVTVGHFKCQNEPDYSGIEKHIIKKALDERKAEIDAQMMDEKCKIYGPQWNKLQCVSGCLAVVLNHLEHNQGTPIEKMVKFATEDKSVTVRKEFQQLCRTLAIPIKSK